VVVFLTVMVSDSPNCIRVNFDPSYPAGFVGQYSFGISKPLICVSSAAPSTSIALETSGSSVHSGTPGVVVNEVSIPLQAVFVVQSVCPGLGFPCYCLSGPRMRVLEKREWRLTSVVVVEEARYHAL
jgi:hypothetical protein